MSTAFDRFENFGRKTYNGQDVLKNHFLKIYPIHYTDNTEDESIVSQYTNDDYVWIVDNSIEVLGTFPWHFRPADNKKHVFPYIYKSSKRIKSWEKVKLVPTKQQYVDTAEHKNIAAIYDVYCGKTLFDVFYIGEHTDILEKIPTAIQVKSFAEAKKLSTTDMFWLVPDDVIIGKFFKFSYKPDDWSHNFVHVFSNGDTGKFDGIALFPTSYNPAEKELTHRFYVEKKTISIIASEPKTYPVIEIKDYDDYQLALANCTSDLFWYVPDDVELTNKLNLYFDHHNQYDRTTNHVFLNSEEYDGVALFSIHSPITEKEFTHRFYANKKEHPEIYSQPKKFEQFVINTYEDYKLAKEHSKTEMFWGVPSDVVINQDFDFGLYFTHHNTYDRNITHVFVNGTCNDGIVLHSKNIDLTEREIEYRFYVNQKEWPIVASSPRLYDVYEIENYNDYLYALENTKSDLFWASSKNINFYKSVYSVYFSHHDQNLRKQNHVYLHQNNDTVSYNGAILCSKFSPLTKKEINHRHPVVRIEHDEIISCNRIYDIVFIETYDDYLNALDNSKTEMFWMTSPNIATDNFNFNFTFDFTNAFDRKINHAFLHVVDDRSLYNGLFLCSKHAPLTQKEIEHRHFINVKEWDIVGSTDKFYDQFIIKTYDDYLLALKNSTTELFWGDSWNIDTSEFNFNLYFTHDNEYDRKQNHNFIHSVNGKDHRNGLFLFSKHKIVTEKEIEFRHLVDAKEWNIVASIPIEYQRFTINNYNEYLAALDSSTTEMFWGVPSDVNINIDFEFDLYFTHDNEYDRKTNHVFLNGEHRDGIVLFSKHAVPTEKEVNTRFYINKKDHDIIASYPMPYDKFIVETYEDYLNAFDNSTTDMFWATTHNIKINKTFDFNLYFSHHNTYDRNINHTFVHCVDNKDYYNGLFLLTKNSPLKMKEIEYRLIAKRKEHNTVASGPVEYEKFKINSYKDYTKAVKNSKTEMFWMIPPEVNVDPNFKFDMYFTHDQRFERETSHNFKNGDAWDGINLVSKHALITEREIDMRFLTNKKQYDITASTPLPYDIVFISKDEEHADENYNALVSRFPNAKRVHGVEGIHQAHIAAAKLCSTDMIWIVDADAKIVENFNFDYYIPAYDPDSRKTVHVWKSQNPINGLMYGYGAVKLFPRELTLNMDVTTPDMTTSISKLFKPVNRISNITQFNTDEFSSWRSAFRETVKLSSRTIKGQLDEETEFRLNAWCTRGKDKPFGIAAINGAKLGKKYGHDNQDNREALRKINDFNWLFEQFNQSSQ